MDHIFEQKLIRENQQLQLELAKINKQIKQLQETIVGYESLLNELNVTGRIQQGFKTGGVKGAVKGGVGALMHNLQRPSAKARASQLGDLAATFRAGANVADVDAQVYDQLSQRGLDRGRSSSYGDLAAISAAFKERNSALANKKQRNADRFSALGETYVSNDRMPMSEDEWKKKLAADKSAAEALKGKSAPKIPTTVRMPRNPKLNKLEESHTKNQLEKLPPDKLKALKKKYTGKPGSKTELNNIKDLLKKKVNEELLNEIGDTPAGQTALKLTRARANAMMAWDSTVGDTMAKLEGPEAVEKNKNLLAKNQRVMDLATKRIKPQ